jgi:hypothetical protein
MQRPGLPAQSGTHQRASLSHGEAIRRWASIPRSNGPRPEVRPPRPDVRLTAIDSGRPFPGSVAGISDRSLFRSLLEHASALGKFLCICRLTPHAEQKFPLASATRVKCVPLGREISVDRMSYKNASAKQTQNYRDHFNHFDAPVLHSLSTSDGKR